LGLRLFAALCRLARLATAIPIGHSAISTKRRIEPLGKLTERCSRAAKVTVLFFQVANGVQAFSQSRVVVLGHTSSFPPLNREQNKDRIHNIWLRWRPITERTLSA
jgi:hypothetical protein